MSSIRAASRGFIDIGAPSDGTILQNLTTAYRETDKVISNMTRWVVEPNISYFQSVESFHARLRDFRNQVLSTTVPNMTVPQVIKFYSDDNAIIVRWVGQVIQHSKSGDLWKTLVGYYMLILSKEQAGVERALGSTFYAKGGYNDQEMLGYLERKILGMTYLERCTEYSTSVNILLKNVFIGKETDINLQRMRSEILRNALNGSDVVMGAQWFNNMTKYINILKHCLPDNSVEEFKVTMASIIPKLLTFLVVQLVIVDVSAKTAIQCLEGVNKTMVPLSCGNQYIDIKNVSVGTPTRKSGCDIDSTNDVCCNQSNACLYPNTTLFNELASWCFQRKSCDIPLWAVASIAQSCNSSVYQLFATFMVVDYECVDTPPTSTSTTTPTMPSASTVAMPMTTSFYSNNLTMGEQAAIICCIMLFIVLIGTAVVIYKRIKYGPPEDFRKLFSKPPENPGNDSPGMTPWLPGEAQEQVYQKMAETQKKKKRKFPKFKF
nr:CAGuanylate cyclase 32E; Guanylate cyclase soluble subunit beta-2; Receptor-type guanylate cyclase gcy-19; Head-specific guanylate cyclase; Retinal guanylyl cyclase 2; Heat-stable enterotoxin receptor; Olfactory guanylyl cyclase GC-D; Atrial natriuretic peptide receptor 2; Receptor-type guanylate cyclase gcy-9; Receptor-type guanylate cyclase Gyc76C; Receptor-type guanylate cyclase gcy-18; Receptor-type guanylate cyclase gcy-28; Speract receptor; Receptor-type guanylate cyclase gcy-29; Receptor-